MYICTNNNSSGQQQPTNHTPAPTTSGRAIRSNSSQTNEARKEVVGESDAASPYIGLSTSWANATASHLTYTNALVLISALARAALQGRGNRSQIGGGSGTGK
jgi:hypothetical protein